MKANQQIPTKSIANQSGNSLLVHSIFYTIQGEGPFAGSPAVFVRLAGCNLQCPGCDTEYTEGASQMGVGDICEAIEQAAPGYPVIVITGGEPFRQPLAILTRSLVAMRYTVQIETNGTLPAPSDMPSEVVVVCSPKTGNINHMLRSRINAWKYVARDSDINQADGLPDIALGHSNKGGLARPTNDAPVYLQPMDEQDPVLNHMNTSAVVQSCLKHGHHLCLQMHKIVGVE